MKQKLYAVSVMSNEHGDEYYALGQALSTRPGVVTDIKWGETPGQMAMIRVVEVYIDGHLSSIHPLPNVLGVYFSPPEEMQ